MRNGPNMSNDRVITQHLQWLRRVSNRAATYKHRRDNLYRCARALQVPLLEASPEDLDEWQRNLTVSDSSVQTYTGHVRAFYRWVVERGLRDDNPAENLPMPRLPKRLPRPIPNKDLVLAFRAASGDMVIWLALSGWCGLRAGEISRLSDESLIEYDDGTMLLVVDGKGGKQRRVPVPTDMQSMIRRANKRGPWFRQPSGKPVSPSYVSHTTSMFFQSLGLPYVLHQCRHRFGTEFYRLCKDIRQTQETMGHGSPQTTALYVAVSESQTAKTANRLGKSLPKLDQAA